MAGRWDGAWRPAAFPWYFPATPATAKTWWRPPQGADLLIHEALSTEDDKEGASRRGHCTAAEAARAAALAGAEQLVITHIDTPFHHNTQPLADEARSHYEGPVSVADDLFITTVSRP